MTLRAIAHWAITLAYVFYVVSQHENVQVFLVPIAQQLGKPLFYSLFGAGAVIFGLLAFFTFWRASARSEARNSLRRHWAVVLAATLGSFLLLTVNNAEVVHYPQYFVLAILIFPWTRSIGDTLAWCTLVALFDEGYQYFVIHPTWGVPWDFNDVTLDICGGWLGSLWCAARARAVAVPNANWWRKTGLLIFFSSLAILPLLVALGKVQLYENKNYVGWWFALSRMQHNGFWFFDETWGPRTIHLLSPVEGLVLMLMLILTASAIDRRYRFTP